MNPKLSFIVFLLLGSLYTTAQENSPFSRYGLGDIYPGQNIVNRASGGIGSTYAHGQSVNFSNPASYSELKIVTYDIGLSLDSRTLRSASPVQKYNSVNLEPSYVALGMPLSSKHNLGLAFGLKPLTKISYSILETKKVRADSMAYLYEGDGGLYQAFVGIGKRWGGLRIGINSGYMFGHRNNNTRAIPIDTVNTYKSNSSVNTSYGSVFFNGGLQYDVALSKTKGKTVGNSSILRFGLSGNLKQNLSAKQTTERSTFTYDANGTPIPIDTVSLSQETAGTIKLPGSFTAGISIINRTPVYDRSSISIEYESTQWSNYRFYDQPDRFNNSWLFKVGGQLTPNLLSMKSYWNTVTYRAGFYFGQEALNVQGKMPVYALTLGAGLPVRKFRSYDNQYTILNTAFEIGKRGNNSNNITESFFRFSLGLNLSDIWFKKRKYD